MSSCSGTSCHSVLVAYFLIMARHTFSPPVSCLHGQVFTYPTTKRASSYPLAISSVIPYVIAVTWWAAHRTILSRCIWEALRYWEGSYELRVLGLI